MYLKPKILVVDDENVVRTSFNRVLSEDGYAVSTEPDGAHALERLRDERFDIAFVDLKMPGMSGLDVARNMRRNQPQMQIIIVTGYCTAEAEKEASELGVTGFVSKPVSPEGLTGLAEQAWQKHQAAAAEAAADSAIAASAAATMATPAAVPAPASEPEAATAPPTLTQTVGALIGGSILGLIYVVFLPVIGLGMLAWLVCKKPYDMLKRAKARG